MSTRSRQSLNYASATQTKEEYRPRDGRYVNYDTAERQKGVQ